MSNFILIGDIGGTNTRLSLIRIKNHQIQDSVKDRIVGDLVFNNVYMNTNFPDFLSLYYHFKTESKIKDTPLVACLAVAGPVQCNRVVFTNRESWNIDGEKLAQLLGIKVVQLINDFVANGYGLLTLDIKKECKILQDCVAVAGAPIACIGAGTGLGECYLTPDVSTGQYSSFPSEGGHAEFAPKDDLETKLLGFLKHKFESKHRVSVERVVSGTGLANVYEFLCTEMPSKVSPAIDELIKKAGDMKGAIIASNTQSELCAKVMEIFATAYGSEAGVAALKFLPFGGLYLTGGLTPKNIQLISDPHGPFLRAFYDKGRVSGLLKSIPLYAVMVEDLGMRGAQLVAIRHLSQQQLLLCNTNPTTTTSMTSISTNSLTQDQGMNMMKKEYKGKNSIALITGIIATVMISVLVSLKK